MPPLLARSFKQRFPFTLAAPSFVYADDYTVNVERLGPFVDEIELLLFESRSLPPEHTMTELAALGRTLGVGYNVHLPSDVSLGHADPRARRSAIAAILAACDRSAPLAPSAMTLHIPFEGEAETPGALDDWNERVHTSLLRLIGSRGSPAGIAIETLDYPLEWLAGIIDDLKLDVCVDVGHLLLHGRDAGAVIGRFLPRVPIIHLHAVANGRDHLGLNRLSPADAAAVLEVLAGFKGIVCLEVFNFEDLRNSLEWLEKNFSGCSNNN